MTDLEFAEIVAYISAAVQKPLAKDATAVYFDLLGDLPVAVMRSAAKKVVLEHQWATFPTVAELRRAALEMQRNDAGKMTPQEAWAIAWRAAAEIDPDVHGEYVQIRNGVETRWESLTACVMSQVPPEVARVMKLFGIHRLVSTEEPPGVLQKQFCETYSGILQREQRDALLPPSLREAIARIGKEKPDEPNTRQLGTSPNGHRVGGVL